MTTATDTLDHRTPGASPLDGIRLSFAGLFRSEWIKLRSLRSTVWCLGIVIVLAIGLAAAGAGIFHLEDVSQIPADQANSYLVSASTIGVVFTQLAVAVLGVLVISGEYATGMIRSTYTADPRRLGAYFAKLIVLTVVVFVVGVISIGVSALVAMGIFHARGLDTDLMSSSVLLPMLGGAAYLTLIAMLAFAFGSVIRNSAGGIATILGALLVLPIVGNLIFSLTQAKWIANVTQFLPSQSGAQLYAYVAPGTKQVTMHDGLLSLNAWQGGLVVLGWVVVVAVIGAILTKKRDV
ncbi:ABC transporter permease subunit [Humibacter ginsenosidimutans]|uniref:ABC transporter permease subunit n=1 Tax=Humibacter ginsenosidimutans TaxID=2599293 RepID=A0A5B8M1W0_9MICO|nr:ABC transporter permease subunit [Humibacter ginsenosidimutans]QDZ14031.1 ABC transporter permease subunit [Humibacter ginsenosidimutans]